MVNNLGGLSVLETSVVVGETVRQLRCRGLRISRLMTGTFLSSLDGPGFSISLLALDGEIRELLDSPTDAPAWPHDVAVLDDHSPSHQITPAVLKPSGSAHPSNYEGNG